MKTLSGRNASQRDAELYPFIDLLIEEGVASYLEIGSREGDTFFEVMCSLPVGSKGVAVDLPAGPWGIPGTREKLEFAVSELCAMGYDASCVFGDSREVEVDGPFDAVFIDGDHRYEAVKADWEKYGPMSRLVAFHDIDGEGIKKGDMEVEVPRLWRELKPHYRHVEFNEGTGMGIGVLWRL